MTHDIVVQNCGTVWVLWCGSDEGDAWLDANIDSRYVEPRYAGAILFGAQEDGLSIAGHDNETGEIRPLVVQAN